MKKIGRLHALTDAVLQNRFSHQELADLAISGGADTIQYRQKSGSTKALIETAVAIKRVCAEKGASFIVNDRIDVAIAADADGVHLGQDDFPVGLARNLLGKTASSAHPPQPLRKLKPASGRVPIMWDSGPFFPPVARTMQGR